MLLTAIITAVSLDEAKQQLHSVLKSTDAIELRLDFLATINLKEIELFIENNPLPTILTLRTQAEGGCYQNDGPEYLQLLEQIADLGAEYIDIEHHVSADFINQIAQRVPNTKIIFSYHNVQKTPKNLNEILDSMRNSHVAIYKIVTMAHSTLDAMRMLHFVKKNSHSVSLVAHCLGEYGVSSRILGPIVGNVITYASIDGATLAATGCLTFDALTTIYHSQQLNSETAVYALIGDPVQQSMGHYFHNDAFQQFDINAVYVKLRLKDNELADFFSFSKELPFKGFSITTPHKENVLKHLHGYRHNINMSIVNTVRLCEKQCEVCNTDGVGALDAIEENISVESKCLLLIGAGGAALAIADEAKKRGSKVTVINRTLSRASTLAAKLDCHGLGFDAFLRNKKQDYDVVINAIANDGSQNEVLSQVYAHAITSDTIVMDIAYCDTESACLKCAKNKNCEIVDGKKMFVNQAIAQLKFWFQLDEHNFQALALKQEKTNGYW